MTYATLRVSAVAIAAVLAACSAQRPQAEHTGEGRGRWQQVVLAEAKRSEADQAGEGKERREKPVPSEAERPRVEDAGEAKERGQELVRIEFEMPKPPPHSDSEIWAIRARMERDGLDPIPDKGKPHPPLLAPKGTRNVALKKPVTSSDKEPVVGELAQITDGDKWACEGSLVELAHGPQWVQIDLQGKHDIHAILFWHWHLSPRFYHDVVVQVANDPVFVLNVRTLFNNDRDNSLGLGKGSESEYKEPLAGKLITCKGTPARYVRLYSCGNVLGPCNHYVEVEVYGSPAK